MAPWTLKVGGLVFQKTGNPGLYRGKSYLSFDDKEFKWFLAVGQRHREMKLSVCRVVIIANRSMIDNAARGVLSHRQYLRCSRHTSVLPPPRAAFVESEGRFALHATSFSSRSTWCLTSREQSHIRAGVACAHTHRQALRDSLMLNYCYSRSSAR